MRVDRALAEHELLGDLAVRTPGGDELGDLALAGGQRAVLAGGGPADAMAEAAQLADRLVAIVVRAEADRIVVKL